MREREHSYEIIPERDHYEVYIDGLFYCSADTLGEAVEEVEEFLYGGVPVV